MKTKASKRQGQIPQLVERGFAIHQQLTVLPGRLTSEAAAWHLGFAMHDIPVRLAQGLPQGMRRPPWLTEVIYALGHGDLSHEESLSGSRSGLYLSVGR